MSQLDEDFQARVDPLRPELLAHCYRMTGARSEAEELVQEALLRAWRGQKGFTGRGSFRAWMFRIATNVCLTALKRRSARRLPVLETEHPDPGLPLGQPLALSTWIEPFVQQIGSPEAAMLRRERVSLAFVFMLQHLTPRQRAALLLCDVAGFEASEAAELLEVSTGSVQNARVRARAAVDAASADVADPPREAWDRAQDFRRVVESGDLLGLAAMLRDDTVLRMPPFPIWYRGADEILAFLGSRDGFRPGNLRLEPVFANDAPAFGLYERVATGGFEATGLQIITIENGQLAMIDCYLDGSYATGAGMEAVLR